MQKIFTLIIALTATITALAQMPGNLKFIGNGEFYLPAMQQNTQTATTKDVVTVTMGDETQAFDIPEMHYAAMNMTINPFNIAGLSYTMTGSPANGDMQFEWQGKDITTTAAGNDGAEKTVTVSEFNAAYNHANGELTLALTFKYGNMPFDLHYAVVAYYTKDNAFGLAGQGTKGNPYKVYDASDFISIADNASKDNTFDGVYFTQMADIDFGGNEATPVQLPSIGKDAIVNITNVAWGFEGTYDGNGKVIKGIYHTDNGNDNAGKFNALFASIGKNGIVKNIVFDTDNHVSSHSYTAAIASISMGTIESCVNKADITAAGTFAAGICAYMIKGAGTISHCENFGSVKAMTYANGIVSGSQSGNAVSSYEYLVNDCANHGNMSTTNGVGAAGIAGAYSGALAGCSNDGTIDDSAKAGQYTAGILACGSYITGITDCSNTGNVTGTKNIGGIAGGVMKGDDADINITGCKNYGAVKATGANVGGIMGNSLRVNGVVTLDMCENHGTVESTAATELIGNLRGNASIVINDFRIGADLARLPLDPEYDGVANVAAAAGKAAKNGAYIKNGRVVIMKDGSTYSVTGVRY